MLSSIHRLESYAWSDNKVRELIAINVLHTSLLNITVFSFKVFPFFFNLHSGGWRIWWNEWQGKPKYSEKTCPNATLSTTNPT
jgi:hypothetical protein